MDFDQKDLEKNIMQIQGKMQSLCGNIFRFMRIMKHTADKIKQKIIVTQLNLKKEGGEYAAKK